MKIAIATEGNLVSSHFGRCENFTICELADNKVSDRKVVSTEGNQHGSLPGFLADQNVSLVISGGMGSGAMDGLKQNGIEFIIGVHGTVDEAIEKYAGGQLVSSDVVCGEHHHDHGEGHKCKCSCHKK